MDRLAEQVVAWHNSHPLAKRISIYDVHTIGVVALPFMRSGAAAGLPGAPRGQIEPVLTDAVSTESLAAWGTEESTIAANTNAAHLDALADQEALPPSAKPAWRQRLLALFRRGSKAAGPDSWPAFSERFVENLSARRVAGFAARHGYSVRPGDATWPHRVVPIDDQLMSREGTVGGAWPFEMYLMSAAIDAGRSRSRILAGRSAGAALPPMLGRRCLDAKRLGLAALIPLCVVSAAAAVWWQRGGSGHEAQSMAAAGAASAAASAASGPATAVAAAAVLPASAPAHAAQASAPAEAPVAPVTAAASAASAPVMAGDPAGSAPTPPIADIRPRFVEPARPADYKGPPLHAATAPATAAASGPARAAAAAKPASAVVALPITPVRPDIHAAALKGTPVVALVAPPMRNKAEAEATLARMRELVLPLQPDPQLMQAQLFESPEGWRPAVWPFASRIEAQLVNATLVARGLHTKAVNF